MHNYVPLDEKTITKIKKKQSMAMIYGIKRWGKI